MDHSFWVPQLAGKTDLIPNHPNDMWIEPAATGLYVGQCAQFCGIEHAKMLMRVYVDTPGAVRRLGEGPEAARRAKIRLSPRGATSLKPKPA